MSGARSFQFSLLAKKLIFLFWLHFQVMWLVDIFRAKIVDISDHSLTIEVMLFLFVIHVR